MKWRPASRMPQIAIAESTAQGYAGRTPLEPRMTKPPIVKLTANFERNLEDIERFLTEARSTAGPSKRCWTNCSKR
jgi:hypothetical protein